MTEQNIPQNPPVAEGHNPDAGAPAALPGKIEFTSDQQVRIDALISDAYKRAYAKASANNEPLKPLAGKPEKDASLMTAELERVRGQVESLRGERKTNALLKSITRYNVIDVDEIVSLTGGNVKLNDDNTLTVLNSTGQERLNAHGHPLSLDDYVAEWLKTRPHHLRASGMTGGGTQTPGMIDVQGTQIDLSNPMAWRTMPREAFDKLLSDGVNVPGSKAVGQSFRFSTTNNSFVEARKKALKGGSS